MCTLQNTFFLCCFMIDIKCIVNKRAYILSFVLKCKCFSYHCFVYFATSLMTQNYLFMWMLCKPNLLCITLIPQRPIINTNIVFNCCLLTRKVFAFFINSQIYTGGYFIALIKKTDIRNAFPYALRITTLL